MKEWKEDLQYFIYFFFKGSLDVSNDISEDNYIDSIISNKEALYNCFRVFALGYVKHGFEHGKLEVTRFISEYFKGYTLNHNVKVDKLNDSSFWKEFLDFAECFCYNTFPDPMNQDYLSDLAGVGSDAVQVFATWCNVVELDDTGKVVNAQHALKRANERIKLWEGVQPSKSFEQWETDQEIW